jgi:S-(hydroxymethyl)glutathione dehydrogenase/alcohol dehydrogenase
VEASGRSRVIEQAFESVRRGGGTCVFASHPEHGSRISIDPYELICGKQIRGSWGGNSDPDRDIPRFADLYAQGKLPLEKLLSKRYRLDDINAALDDLEQGRVARPLIEIDTSLG